ncbi:MAG: alternative ribosome rescue aminoacyl-tRNA hydrolase ArfB [Bacteroidota bacterium]
MENILVTRDIIVPESALEFRFSRSSGKGGQNVNKVSTKVELLLSLDAVITSDEMKELLSRRLASQLDSQKKIHFLSQESRSQLQNKRMTVKKMVQALLEAAAAVKERVQTKKSKSSKEKQIIEKKKQGAKKNLRRKNFMDAE